MHLKQAAILGILILAAQASAQPPQDFKNEKDKLSYAMGMDLGNSLRKRSIEIDTAVFSQGLKDALSGGKTRLTETEVRAAITNLENEAKQKLVNKNKREGVEFLAKNKSKEGVVSLPSGLQYKILKSGDGQKPSLEDTVVCNYRGTLIDGTEFDSSYKRGQPATLPLKRIIKGWAEALQIMPVGSKWQLFIPPELAYGERGVGPVGPETALVFEVELLSIQAKP